MGTPYLAWRKRKFLPWKIKALLRVKSEGPYPAQSAAGQRGSASWGSRRYWQEIYGKLQSIYNQ